MNYLYDLPEACYRVSVRGIYIHENGKYMISRKGSKWGLPGGGVDHGETYQEALVRELKEETGLCVTHVHQVPEYFLTGTTPGGRLVAYVYVSMDIESVDVYAPSRESQEIGFFTKDELKKMRNEFFFGEDQRVDYI